HAGPLGRMFNPIGLTDNEGQVAIRALKKAEDSDDYVLRVQELEGRPTTKYVKFAVPFQTAREINAAEESVPASGDLKFGPNGLQISLKPYRPRTIAIRLKNNLPGRALRATSDLLPPIPLTLPFNLDGVSTDANRADGDL